MSREPAGFPGGGRESTVNRSDTAEHSETCDARNRPDGTDDEDWGLLREAHPADGLAVLFARHKDFVYRVARGVIGRGPLAEDVVQEVFLRLFEGRRRWRPRARLRTLLYRITLNTTRELRRRSARELPEPDPGEERRVTPPSPALADLERLLDTLPERQREAVVLRYLEGMSTAEAARAMGCSTGTVKAHLHRALGRLHRSLSEAPTQPSAATASKLGTGSRTIGSRTQSSGRTT